MNATIHSYIKEKEADYETQEIRVGDNWNFNMRNHIQLIFHLKNGVFFSGHNDFLRSFKNIMEPILNLAYWTEDIEVKDVVFFIESKGGRALSFLIKKYHDEVYTREHDLDEMFDEITESDIDYGGVIVQKNKDKPEIKQLQSIAFCDQTNILGGPIGFKESFSPEALRKEKKRGWGDPKNGATISIDDLIMLADDTKETQGLQSTKRNEVTGKNVDVYIVIGSLPDAYLTKDSDNFDDWIYQVQVVAFYTDKDNKVQNVTLFRKKSSDDILSFFTSKKVHGRGLGRGEGEVQIHPQIWTNFLEIHKLSLIEAGSKVVLYTDDENYPNRNEINDMEQLQITTVADGKVIRNVPTLGVNQIQMMTEAVNGWFDFAQIAGAAQDPLIGSEAKSGTTFRGQERTVAQGRGSHDRKRGKRAKFIEKLYRDSIIPEMVREITDGKKFLATLDSNELSWVSDQLAENFANRKITDDILSLKPPQDKELLKQEFLNQFSKKGSKHLIEILKGEFKGIEVKMGINIAGKQKNLADLSDKILSIFQFAFADPLKWQQGMQVPGLAKMFNNLLEFSGMDLTDFTDFVSKIPEQQQQLPAPQPQRQQAPLELNKEHVL